MDGRPTMIDTSSKRSGQRGSVRRTMFILGKLRLARGRVSGSGLRDLYLQTILATEKYDAHGDFFAPGLSPNGRFRHVAHRRVNPGVAFMPQSRTRAASGAGCPIEDSRECA